MAIDRIALADGNITELDVDVLVNAANAALSGGGGVDGAIHAAAGPGLLAECRTLGRCEPGDAVLTAGHGLAAAHVVHAVGPVWHGGDRGERALLESTYRAALRLVTGVGAGTVAFPAISCGAYRFPVQEAAGIAVTEVIAHLRDNDRPSQVVFCCFDRPTRRAYERALAAHGWRGGT